MQGKISVENERNLLIRIVVVVEIIVLIVVVVEIVVVIVHGGLHLREKSLP
jgi:hypothetical protein